VSLSQCVCVSLIDCGEGTQVNLIQNRVKQSRIEAIFISHLHGDHYLGLVGLISSMHLLGRRKQLKLFAPPGLREIITTQLKYSNTILNFEIDLKELSETSTDEIYTTSLFSVNSFKLNHRIPSWGFIFSEKPKPRRINKDKLPESILIEEILKLKDGQDVFDKTGKIKYKNVDLTLPPKKSRSYAYCSDTIYDESVIKYIKDVDLLYHEATFLKDKEDVATQTFHSTAGQAALIAKKARVKKLLIGHFSARYKDTKLFEYEAREVFNNTELAIEGKDYCVEE